MGQQRERAPGCRSRRFGQGLEEPGLADAVPAQCVGGVGSAPCGTVPVNCDPWCDALLPMEYCVSGCVRLIGECGFCVSGVGLDSEALVLLAWPKQVRGVHAVYMWIDPVPREGRWQ